MAKLVMAKLVMAMSMTIPIMPIVIHGDNTAEVSIHDDKKGNGTE